MFQRILVPLDGSPLAERAIPHAEKFARIFGARIVLLRVLEVSSDENQGPVDLLSWQIHKTEASEYMGDIVSRIRDHLKGSAWDCADGTTGENRVEYAVLEGKNAESIVDFAHNEHIDLVVISSHGSGGLSRWNMSSVIQKIIDQVFLPLLIVRSQYEQPETSDPIQYRNILLPIDSSRRAECTFPAAIFLTQGESHPDHLPAEELPATGQPSPEALSPDSDLNETRLFLAAVIKPPEIPIPKPYPFDIASLADQLLEVSRQAVHTYLNEIQLRLPVKSENRVVESNNVASAIQALSQQEDIDLIIISAHGNTEQFTHPYGDVTRNLIEHSTKSLLVIQDMPRSQFRIRSIESMTATRKPVGHYKVREERLKLAHERPWDVNKK